MVYAGPYTEAGIPKDDPSIVGWATGYLNYSRSDNDNGFNDPTLALGHAVGDSLDVVSLGDVNPPDDGVAPGRITLTFDDSIVDGDGWDIVVFENSFGNAYPSSVFAELAYVEVSTDGVVFARFPAISNIPYSPGGFAFPDVSDCYNLAGKQLQGVGGPFDLSELLETPKVLSGEVDINNINYVRIVDIPGYGTQDGTMTGYVDSLGNPIHDNWPTAGSGGFDLDAVGYIHGNQGDDDHIQDDDDDNDDDSQAETLVEANDDKNSCGG